MSENEKHPAQSGNHGSQTTGRHEPQRPTEEQEGATPFTKWPWQAQLVIALSIMLAVIVLLVGLPVASMLITDRISPGSLDGTVSFWGASFAAFISLAVIFIGSAFAFTAFKVETNAQKQMEQALWDAQKEALEVANKQVPKLLKEVEEKALREVREQGQEAVKQVQEEGQKRLNEIRTSADEAIKRNADVYVQEHGETITKTAASEYMEERGEGIAKIVASEYMDEHGAGISDNAASRFLRDNGETIAKSATNVYMEETGQEIIKSVTSSHMEEKAQEIIGSVSNLYMRENGEKTIEKTVLDYIEKNIAAATVDEPTQRKLLTRLKNLFGPGRNIED